MIPIVVEKNPGLADLQEEKDIDDDDDDNDDDNTIGTDISPSSSSTFEADCGLDCSEEIATQSLEETAEAIENELHILMDASFQLVGDVSDEDYQERQELEQRVENLESHNQALLREKMMLSDQITSCQRSNHTRIEELQEFGQLVQELENQNQILQEEKRVLTCQMARFRLVNDDDSCGSEAADEFEYEDEDLEKNELKHRVEELQDHNHVLQIEKRYFSDQVSKLQDKIQVLTSRSARQLEKTIDDSRTLPWVTKTNLVEECTERRNQKEVSENNCWGCLFPWMVTQESESERTA